MPHDHTDAHVRELPSRLSKSCWDHDVLLSLESLAHILQGDACHELNHQDYWRYLRSPTQTRAELTYKLIHLISSSDFFHPWNSLLVTEPSSNHFQSTTQISSILCSGCSTRAVHGDTFTWEAFCWEGLSCMSGWLSFCWHALHLGV